MSMRIKIKKEDLPKTRSQLLLDMQLHCKGGRMRHKNERRSEDKGRMRKEWDQ